MPEDSIIAIKREYACFGTKEYNERSPICRSCKVIDECFEQRKLKKSRRFHGFAIQ